MSKFSRMMDIVMYLQARSLVKAQELADMLETDLKTVYRDIESLRTANIPIEAKSGRYGGFYIPKDFYFKAPKLTPEEIAVLFFAGEILVKKNGFMFEKDFKTALSKLKNTLAKEEINISSDKISSISYEIESLKTRLWENLFYIIEKCISEKKSIDVEYYTLSRDEVKRRTLDPYHLIYKNGAWYLIAFCHWRKEVKIFRVDRIKSIDETGIPFKIKKGFSLRDYLKNSWQITRGEEADVVVRFFPPASRLVKEMEWLPTQKIIEEKDGTIIFSAKVSGLMEIKRWILGYGSQAEVLKPQSLREEISSEIKKMLKHYTSTGKRHKTAEKEDNKN
ncbi:transcriptional regulator [Biomaibacter acetigenes]|uniref:Transcriptional regulator n=1 Tax=Biomaibacter acetigenes TaxID=2316383 RepID=A0A3G2R441_9FIRM|nr:transcriptional regulator [Biomaibacter acetigenes]AYO30162.1 transcriptional regulator [Biomaibacter acetigenes]